MSETWIKENVRSYTMLESRETNRTWMKADLMIDLDDSQTEFIPVTYLETDACIFKKIEVVTNLPGLMFVLIVFNNETSI